VQNLLLRRQGSAITSAICWNTCVHDGHEFRSIERVSLLGSSGGAPESRQHRPLGRKRYFRKIFLRFLSLVRLRWE
jgi:hypothetical protein